MPFALQLTFALSKGPKSDDGFPTATIDEQFATPEDAADTARRIIEGQGFSVGSVWYMVLDENGKPLDSFEGGKE